MQRIRKLLAQQQLIVLSIIFLLGLVLRFYQLGVIPDGFHSDEAYFGYNAYSILKTGRELTGAFLPVHLASFLFSPAGYSYFAIIPIVFFGLNAFAIRFPSVVFGSLTILTTYFLAKELFQQNKQAKLLGVIAALCVAISPWSINLSRVSTENVIVVFFLTLGVYFYIVWARRNNFYFALLSFASFVITLFLYQAPRSFLPLFLPVLFIYCLGFSIKHLKKNRKLIISVIFYVLCILLPILLVLKSPDLSYRLRTLSIFQNPGTQLSLNEQLREDGISNISPSAARLFHNKMINYSETFLKNYAKHFSYEFLFTDSGLPDRYRIPSMGLLYLFDLPLLLFGIWYLLHHQKKEALLLFSWILFAPVGSALTFDDVPNLQRTFLLFPALPIVITCGVLEVWNYLKRTRYTMFASSILLIFVIYSFAFFIHSYFVHGVVHRPWYRQEGYRDLVAQLTKLSPQYKKTVITTAQGNPTIFLLFYTRYDPGRIQKIMETISNRDYGNVSFANFVISTDQCPLREIDDIDPKTNAISSHITGQQHILYVDSGTCTLPKFDVHVLSNVNRKDGTTAFILLTR